MLMIIETLPVDLLFFTRYQRDAVLTYNEAIFAGLLYLVNIINIFAA